MKGSITRVLLTTVVVGGALMVGPVTRFKPTVVHAQTEGCRLTTLKGSYGFAVNGYVNTGSPVPFTPLAAAGVISFRADGSLKRAFSISFGGTVFKVNDSGNYMLNEDCTFNATLPNAGEIWNLIPVDHGEQIEFFVNNQNNQGSVVAGTLTLQ